MTKQGPQEPLPLYSDPSDILTPAELASRLKVGKNWPLNKVRRRDDNGLPCLRVGSYIRFSWRAVSDWLAQQPTALKPVQPGKGRPPKKKRAA